MKSSMASPITPRKSSSARASIRRTEMGPLVSEEQLNRVSNYMHQGKKAGACYVTGGDRAGQRGYFVKPTVVKDVKPNMSIVREEIFGPVVVAEPLRKREELIPRANQTHVRPRRGRLDARHFQSASHRCCTQAPEQFGSTVTIFSMRPCPSAVTNNPAGAAKWATRFSNTIRRQKRWSSDCNHTHGVVEIVR